MTAGSLPLSTTSAGRAERNNARPRRTSRTAQRKSWLPRSIPDPQDASTNRASLCAKEGSADFSGDDDEDEDSFVTVSMPSNTASPRPKEKSSFRLFGRRSGPNKDLPDAAVPQAYPEQPQVTVDRRLSQNLPPGAAKVWTSPRSRDAVNSQQYVPPQPGYLTPNARDGATPFSTVSSERPSPAANVTPLRFMRPQIVTDAAQYDSPTQDMPQVPIRSPKRTSSLMTSPVSGTPIPVNQYDRVFTGPRPPVSSANPIPLSKGSGYNPMAAFYGAKSTTSPLLSEPGSPATATQAALQHNVDDMGSGSSVGKQAVYPSESTKQIQTARLPPVATAMTESRSREEKPDYLRRRSFDMLKEASRESYDQPRASVPNPQTQSTIVHYSVQRQQSPGSAQPQQMFATTSKDILSSKLSPIKTYSSSVAQSIPTRKLSTRVSVDSFEEQMSGRQSEQANVQPIYRPSHPSRDRLQSDLTIREQNVVGPGTLATAVEPPTPTEPVYSVSRLTRSATSKPMVQDAQHSADPSWSDADDSPNMVSSPIFSGGSTRSSMLSSYAASSRTSFTSDEIHTTSPPSPKLVARPRELPPTASKRTMLTPAPAIPLEQMRLIVLTSLLIRHLDWQALFALRASSAGYRKAFDQPAIHDQVLARYLSQHGYRAIEEQTIVSMMTLPSNSRPPRSMRLTSNGKRIEQLDISYKDLEGFLISRQFEASEMASLAKEHQTRRLHPITFRMLQAACRSWSRVMMRIRNQPTNVQSTAFDFLSKEGRAAKAKVFVPAQSNWMSDGELIECERELWRAGVWSSLVRGDCVHNCAIGSFANEGIIIFDGKYLRDLSYNFDFIGHLPSWLNVMTFSPAYFHSVIATSTADGPVAYLDLTPFSDQIRSGMQLVQVQANTANANGKSFKVTKYVYRCTLHLETGKILGSAIGKGGVEVLHSGWEGQLVIETEGTTEHSAALVAIAQQKSTYSSRLADQGASMHAFRILRQRSRPGKLYIRPCSAEDQVS